MNKKSSLQKLNADIGQHQGLNRPRGIQKNSKEICIHHSLNLEEYNGKLLLVFYFLKQNLYISKYHRVLVGIQSRNLENWNTNKHKQSKRII